MIRGDALNGDKGMSVKDRKTKFASCFCSMIGQSYLDKTVFALRASPSEIGRLEYMHGSAGFDLNTKLISWVYLEI